MIFLASHQQLLSGNKVNKINSLEEIKLEISESLEEFDKLYYLDELSELRSRYPRYVALYTPVIEEPDFAIIGTNPSWFIGKEPKDSIQNKMETERTESLKKVHNINAYTKYKEPTYHKRVISFFSLYLHKSGLNNDSDQVERFIKENVMGWNSQFIQTGSSGYNNLKRFCMNKGGYFSKVFVKANDIAIKITKLVKPKIIIHFGNPSREVSKEYIGEKIKKREDFGYRVFFHHPSQGYSRVEREEDIDILRGLIERVKS